MTKNIKGTVTSSKNNKTIVVEVTKFTPFLWKSNKRSKYHAHDEKNKFKEGQKVSIIECKPISKENLAGNRIMIQIQTELNVRQYRR